jgi:hypothetical protein
MMLSFQRSDQSSDFLMPGVRTTTTVATSSAVSSSDKHVSGQVAAADLSTAGGRDALLLLHLKRNQLLLDENKELHYTIGSLQGKLAAAQAEMERLKGLVSDMEKTRKTALSSSSYRRSRSRSVDRHGRHYIDHDHRRPSRSGGGGERRRHQSPEDSRRR